MQCNRIVANVFRKHLAQFNVTDSQLSILFVIANAPNPTQKRLADLLHLEKSTVHRNLIRLLKQEVISYSKEKALRLTPSGEQLLEEIMPHWENAMAEIKSIIGDEGENALNMLTLQLTR